MRAARLLQILLLLQNRGRMTSRALADELEVVPRTILRDVDAMTEAGLPIIVHQGSQGGIELGFGYRSRLTGLAADEAEALAIILAHPVPQLEDLGLSTAGARARAKLVESFPERTRTRIATTQSRIIYSEAEPHEADPRVAAVAIAVRNRTIIRLRAKSASPQIVHPDALIYTTQGWMVRDAAAPDNPISIADWGDINISAKSFA